MEFRCSKAGEGCLDVAWWDALRECPFFFPCFFFGDSNMQLSIQEGIKSAQYYNFLDKNGVFIYIGCMFILGSGFGTDPQFPWATAILAKQQNSKANQLYDAAIATLDKWLV